MVSFVKSVFRALYFPSVSRYHASSAYPHPPPFCIAYFHFPCRFSLLSSSDGSKICRAFVLHSFPCRLCPWHLGLKPFQYFSLTRLVSLLKPRPHSYTTVHAISVYCSTLLTSSCWTRFNPLVISIVYVFPYLSLLYTRGQTRSHYWVAWYHFTSAQWIRTTVLIILLTEDKALQECPQHLTEDVCKDLHQTCELVLHLASVRGLLCSVQVQTQDGIQCVLKNNVEDLLHPELMLTTMVHRQYLWRGSILGNKPFLNRLILCLPENHLLLWTPGSANTLLLCTPTAHQWPHPKSLLYLLFLQIYLLLYKPSLLLSKTPLDYQGLHHPTTQRIHFKRLFSKNLNLAETLPRTWTYPLIWHAPQHYHTRTTFLMVSYDKLV